MRVPVIMSILIVSMTASSAAWACNPSTYAGCSQEELRAIQQQQFYGRKYQPAASVSTDSGSYWRDRQYADRVRAEQREHELEIERIRSETEVEVAKQQRRSSYYGNYRYVGGPVLYPVPYRPPLIKPAPPVAVVPLPELKGNIYSNGPHKRVSNAVK